MKKLSTLSRKICWRVAVVVQQPCHVWLFMTPWTAAYQASLSLTISCSLLKFMSTALVMPSNHLILYHLLLLPSIFPSIRVSSNELAVCISWPQHWGFSFSFIIVLSLCIEGWFFFMIYWFDLLAVQGTLKSLLQHHSSKQSILCCSAFFMVQLSQPYMTTGKTITLTIWSLLAKYIQFKFVIAFLPRNKHLLISWLHLREINFFLFKWKYLAYSRLQWPNLKVK